MPVPLKDEVPDTTFIPDRAVPDDINVNAKAYQVTVTGFGGYGYGDILPRDVVLALCVDEENLASRIKLGALSPVADEDAPVVETDAGNAKDNKNTNPAPASQPNPAGGTAPAGTPTTVPSSDSGVATHVSTAAAATDKEAVLVEPTEPGDTTGDVQK